MEKNTITIEIKKDTAVMLLWLVVGVTLVVITFFIPEPGTEFWPLINSAGIVTGVYLIGLLLYILRKPVSFKARLTMGIVSAFMLLVIATVWTRQEDQSRWQKARILKIQKVISHGIMLYQIPDPLFKTLDVYYQQGGKKKETLGQVFQRLNPGAVVGSNIHKQNHERDSLKVFIGSLTDREIVLVGQEAFVKGKDPEFKNFDGKKGIVQERFTLTEKGIIHESQN